jgi:hypothetical protein
MAMIHASQVVVTTIDTDRIYGLQEILKKYEDAIEILTQRVKQLEDAYIEQQLLYKKEE